MSRIGSDPGNFFSSLVLTAYTNLSGSIGPNALLRASFASLTVNESPPPNKPDAVNLTSSKNVLANFFIESLRAV